MKTLKSLLCVTLLCGVAIPGFSDGGTRVMENPTLVDRNADMVLGSGNKANFTYLLRDEDGNEIKVDDGAGNMVPARKEGDFRPVTIRGRVAPEDLLPGDRYLTDRYGYDGITQKPTVEVGTNFQLVIDGSYSLANPTELEAWKGIIAEFENPTIAPPLSTVIDQAALPSFPFIHEDVNVVDENGELLLADFQNIKTAEDIPTNTDKRKIEVNDELPNVPVGETQQSIKGYLKGAVILAAPKHTESDRNILKKLYEVKGVSPSEYVINSERDPDETGYYHVSFVCCKTGDDTKHIPMNIRVTDGREPVFTGNNHYYKDGTFIVDDGVATIANTESFPQSNITIAAVADKTAECILDKPVSIAEGTTMRVSNGTVRAKNDAAVLTVSNGAVLAF